ncbi:MAG: cytochrome c oxidase assembly protein, partial [Bradymonadaceae bacterium]
MTDTPDTPDPDSIDRESESARSPREMDDGKQKTVVYIIGFLMAMFGLAWASIPLYRLVCKQLDPGGGATASNTPDQYEGTKVDESRTIKVHFAANTTRKLPWMFRAPKD